MRTMSRVDNSFDIPQISCGYIPEPLLCFAGGYEHVDPKFGIISSGPKSYEPLYRHPAQVRIVFIGSAETINTAQKWLERGSLGFDGNSEHIRFPGFQPDRGFRSDVQFSDDWQVLISQTEIKETVKIRSSKNRYEHILGLLDSKMRLLSNKDRTPECIILALPRELEKECQTVDYFEKGKGQIHRDLRRSFKTIAMRYHMPTQIIRQQTIEDRTGDVISKIYWNFFTGLYFKAGGSPWGPVGLTPNTCYVGISFFRPLGSEDKRIQTSLVQAFDENGDGLVLRGHDFVWDEDKEGTKSPHLTERQAVELIELVLSQYQAEMGNTPRRVVVHKTSRYWDGEKKGFEQALKNKIGLFDLVALSSQSTVRLITTNKYPPLRGTMFSVENYDYLYTTGFLPELNQFHGMHVPSPIRIADHIGQDTPRERLLGEIMILTKMNWNSSALGGLMPITIRFSNMVADIMREIPQGQIPLASYRFYM